MDEFRTRIKNAAQAMNESRVLPTPIDVHGVDTAEGSELLTIINYFLDSMENVPSSIESTIPTIALQMYNDIVKKVVVPTDLQISNELKQLNFTRNK